MKNVDSITNKAKKVEREIIEAIEKPIVEVFDFNKDLKKQKRLDKKEAKGKKVDSKDRKVRPMYAKVLISTVRVFLLTVSLVALLFSGAVYAYKSQFEDRVLWGTEIFGEDLGGKTKAEVEKIVEEKLSNVKLTFLIDEEEYVVVPEEAGVDFEEAVIVEDVVRNGKVGAWYSPWLSSASSLIHQINPYSTESTKLGFNKIVPPKYRINEESFESFTANLSEEFNTESKNAALVMKGSDVQVVPAIYGKEIVADSIRLQIESAINANGASSIEIDVEEIQPDIIEEETKRPINLAQELISRSVVFSYGDKEYVPGKETIGGWITFEESGSALVPKINSGKLKSYLDNVAKNINIPPVVHKVKIINGKDEEITQQGKDGLAVDTKNASISAAEKLNDGKNVKAKLPTYVVKYKTQVNNVLVASWDKYIEIDISSQKMCAYLKGGEKVNCWSVTTGASGWSTPTGTFLISRKAGAGGVDGGPGGGGVCMPNPPSTTPLCGINYVSTFTGLGHAIHEAWWRSPGAYNDFGNPNYAWNGSHGCINSPYSVAKFIYYWAPIGTPVVIHY